MERLDSIVGRMRDGMTVTIGGQALKISTTYRVVDGEIINRTGRLFTVAEAWERIALICEDSGRAEVLYGQTNPDQADIIQAINAADIRCLRACIKAVSGRGDPQPPAAANALPMEQARAA
ncbi:hypothetical protein ASG17_07750 [Brevundimonas sp. Leaf363]|uniref:hypothetical protein n=1 Tax=Brevundimonas sp. Leaf363 TaxID=1736353 RepID=UPI0006F68623|nr:hypothetical protein [Brevundimonas sp. Leaf363]KQS55936.1 hypothetical protein ASG17_07750 [Brevundimonas sp. Leaf363]